MPLPWAHLRRDFQALADSEDRVVKRLGHDLLRPTRELFRQWSRCRDGTVSRAELKRGLAPVRQQVEGLLLRGRFSGHPRLEGMCRSCMTTGPGCGRSWTMTSSRRTMPVSGRCGMP